MAATKTPRTPEREAERKESAYFGLCAEGRERLMRLRRERSLLWVYPDEWTTPSTVEVASWED